MRLDIKKCFILYISWRPPSTSPSSFFYFILLETNIGSYFNLTYHNNNLMILYLKRMLYYSLLNDVSLNISFMFSRDHKTDIQFQHIQ